MDMEEVYLRQITEHLKKLNELQETNNDLLTELLQKLGKQVKGMELVIKMLVGFAQYFLIVYLFLFFGGVIAGYFFDDFPSVNIEVCFLGGAIGAWRGRKKELNKREKQQIEEGD